MRGLETAPRLPHALHTRYACSLPTNTPVAWPQHPLLALAHPPLLGIVGVIAHDSSPQRCWLCSAAANASLLAVRACVARLAARKGHGLREEWGADILGTEKGRALTSSPPNPISCNCWMISASDSAWKRNLASGWVGECCVGAGYRGRASGVFGMGKQRGADARDGREGVLIECNNSGEDTLSRNVAALQGCSITESLPLLPSPPSPPEEVSEE